MLVATERQMEEEKEVPLKNDVMVVLVGLIIGAVLSMSGYHLSAELLTIGIVAILVVVIDANFTRARLNALWSMRLTYVAMLGLGIGLGLIVFPLI